MRHYLDKPAGWMPPRMAEFYDETSLWGARFGALLCDELEIRRGVRGLDVGCGTGFPLFELAHLHGPSAHFTGVDIWNDALTRARLKRGEYALDNVDIVEADAVAMPFPDASFDLIVSNLGVNNFADAVTALRECRRVATTGARLVLTTNVRGHFREFYALFNALLRERRLTDAVIALSHDEEHRRSKEELVALVGEAGFGDARAVERSFEMRFADGAALLRHSLVKWFLDGWRGAVASLDERELFAEAETRLDEMAVAVGSIRMTVPMLYLETRAG